MRAGALLLTFACCVPPAPRAQEVTLESIFARQPPWGFVPRDLRLSPDGERLLLQEATAHPRTGAPQWRVMLRNAVTGEPLRLPFPVTENAHAAFAPWGHRVLLVRGHRVVAVDDSEEPRKLVEAEHAFAGLREVAPGMVLARAGDEHWLLTRGTRRFQRIPLPRDATLLAAVRNGRRALFVAGKSSGNTDGSGLTALGWTDGRREMHFTLPARPALTAFAADGGAAVFVTYEHPPLGPRQLVPDYLTPEVTVRRVRAARAGDPPPLATLHLVRFGNDVQSELLPLGPHKAPAAVPQRVLTLEFDDRAKRLLVQTLSGDWRTRRILAYERSRPRDVRVVHEEIDERWIGPLARTAFFDASSNGVVFTSEVDDKARVFFLPLLDGARPEPLTPPGVLIDGCWRTPSGLVVVSMAHPDPARRFLAVADVDKRRVVHPDQPPGWNADPVFAAGADRIVFRHSRLYRPAEIWTSSLGLVGRGRRIMAPAPREFVEYRWNRPELVRYQAPDKTEIHALLFMPKGKRPQDGWPAVIFLHGAGYKQNVRDSMTAHPRDLLFHHRLAEKGFVVLSPDYRGSKGYGRKFRTDVAGDLGGPDRRDVVAARRFLFDRCGVDLARIGLYGGSYGGFLTLMCLLEEPNAFACGTAMRPVTDWTRYHPDYVHPRLGSPFEPGGAERYRNASPIHFAGKLQKPLLLLHGMQDDNVFVQDTLRLIDRLVELGKDFDAMVYPSQSHAFDSPAAWIDQYRRIERLFERELKR